MPSPTVGANSLGVWGVSAASVLDVWVRVRGIHQYPYHQDQFCERVLNIYQHFCLVILVPRTM